MGTAVRPAKTSPGPWDAFADVDVFVDEVLAELTAIAQRMAPGRCDPGQSRRWPERRCAQGRHGDLVCLFLWHAVAGDRTAVRHSIRHTLWAVRPLDSAQPLAPVAQPAAPYALAARLR